MTATAGAFGTWVKGDRSSSHVGRPSEGPNIGPTKIENTTSAQDRPTDQSRQQHDHRDDRGTQDADGGELDQCGTDQVTQQRCSAAEHLPAGDAHRHGEEQDQQHGARPGR